MSGNYPPGMTSRDFVRAGIDQPHDHTCEFRPVERSSPVIEDGAARFMEECTYAEGEYGQGWECERGRSYRFDYDSLILLNDSEIALPSIEVWKQVDEDVQEVVIAIEEAFRNGDSRANLNVDPDPSDGEVSIDYLGYTLIFRPQ